MPTSFTEQYHDAAFILWEEDFHYSRDNIVIKSGAGILKPGTVLAQITQTDTAGSVTAKAGMTGNGTCVKDATTPIQTGSQPGTYKIIMTDATHFTVTNPGGETVGTGVAGTAFSDEIKFMLTAGSTPFVAGDEFDFPVVGVAGAGKYVPAVLSAMDGSQIGVAVLIHGVDATSVDVPTAALVRAAQVNVHLLQYDPTINDAGAKAKIAADLNEVGIVVR